MYTYHDEEAEIYPPYSNLFFTIDGRRMEKGEPLSTFQRGHATTSWLTCTTRHVCKTL